MQYEFKGTQGEWKLAYSRKIGTTEIEELTVCSEGYRTFKEVANIWTKDKIRTDGIGIEQALIDAHLLAAAPELLQACIEAFEFIEGYDTSASQSMVNNLSDKLQNAIHKALNIQ